MPVTGSVRVFKSPATHLSLSIHCLAHKLSFLRVDRPPWSPFILTSRPPKAIATKTRHSVVGLSNRVRCKHLPRRRRVDRGAWQDISVPVPILTLFDRVYPYSRATLDRHAQAAPSPLPTGADASPVGLTTAPVNLDASTADNSAPLLLETTQWPEPRLLLPQPFEEPQAHNAHLCTFSLDQNPYPASVLPPTAVYSPRISDPLAMTHPPTLAPFISSGIHRTDDPTAINFMEPEAFPPPSRSRSFAVTRNGMPVPQTNQSLLSTAAQGSPANRRGYATGTTPVKRKRSDSTAHELYPAPAGNASLAPIGSPVFSHEATAVRQQVESDLIGFTSTPEACAKDSVDAGQQKSKTRNSWSEFASVSSQDLEGVDQPYSSIGCNACRLSKLRCDKPDGDPRSMAGTPCLVCIMGNQRCEYTQPKRRGPKPKATRCIDLSSYLLYPYSRFLFCSLVLPISTAKCVNSHPPSKRSRRVQGAVPICSAGADGVLEPQRMPGSASRVSPPNAYCPDPSQYSRPDSLTSRSSSQGFSGSGSSGVSYPLPFFPQDISSPAGRPYAHHGAHSMASQPSWAYHTGGHGLTKMYQTSPGAISTSRYEHSTASSIPLRQLPHTLPTHSAGFMRPRFARDAVEHEFGQYQHPVKHLLKVTAIEASGSNLIASTSTLQHSPAEPFSGFDYFDIPQYPNQDDYGLNTLDHAPTPLADEKFYDHFVNGDSDFGGAQPFYP